VRAPIVAAIVCSAATALANSAAVRVPEPSTATSPELPAETGLRVTREDLLFDCERESLVVRCRFEARYQIDNPGAQRESVVAAFYGVNASEVVVAIDGVASQRPLTAEEAAKLDGRVRAKSGEDDEVASDVSRTGFALSLAPSGKSEVVVTGVMTEQAWDYGSRRSTWAADAIDARHTAFHTTHEGRRWTFRYLLAPLRTWAGSPQIHVRVRGPRGLAHFGGPGVEGDPRFTESVEDGREVVSGTYDAESWPSSLEFGWFDPPPVVRNGGPLIGFGTAGSDDRKFRLRLGWEIASPRWVLYSANVDFDFRGKIIAAPVVKLATPWIAIIPSLGVGFGVPVQLRPEVRAGVRMQFDATLWALGFLVSYDHFPSTSSHPEVVNETAVMLQLGF
jgi:hypothetical protein